MEVRRIGVWTCVAAAALSLSVAGPVSARRSSPISTDGSAGVRHARLSAKSVRQPGGGVFVTAFSNAHTVRVRFVDRSDRTRYRRAPVRHGSARVKLPDGSRSVVVRATKTHRLAASDWTRALRVKRTRPVSTAPTKPPMLDSTQCVNDILVAYDHSWAGLPQVVPIDLNTGAGGKYLYLTYSLGDAIKEPEDCISDIRVVMWFVDTPVRPDTGWHYVGNQYGELADLNAGAGGFYIWLQYARQETWSTDKVRSLVVDFTWGSYPWRNWKLGRLLNGGEADLNAGAGGAYLYLHYSIGDGP